MAAPSTGIWWPNFVGVNDDITFGTNLKLALVKGTWDPTLTSTLGWGSISSHEATGSGYTAGGKALTTVGSTISSDRWRLTADNVSWDPSTIADVEFAVVYDPDATAPVADAVVFVIAYDNPLENNGGSFTIPFKNGEVFDITAIGVT